MDLVEYAAFLSLGSLAPSTIRGNISGVRHHLKIRLMPHFENSFLMALVLKGISNDRPKTADIRLPVSLAMLAKMCTAVQLVADSSYTAILYQSLFTLGFFGLFRPGELTMSTHVIQADNVVLAKDSIVVYMDSSKCHSNTLPPQIVNILAQPAPVCPVFFLRSYLAVRPPTLGPLYVNTVGQPISYAEFSFMLVKICKFLGLPAAQIKPHSFRIGGATNMHIHKATKTQIQTAGRWSSDCFKKYIRL